jgi:O-methyltransferase
MIQENIKREFYAIDTFFGFTKEDILFEQQNRGKTDNYLYYRSNKKDWYSKTLIANGIQNAKIYQADAKEFDYSKIGPLAFCLFDVDLYKPTEQVLPILYDILIPGGVIIVDDCSPELSIYDGAGEAYRNFCNKMGLNVEIANDKLGIIKKPVIN